MNLEVSIWTAYLFFEVSGDVLVQLVGMAAVYGISRLVIEEVSLFLHSHRGR